VIAINQIDAQTWSDSMSPKIKNGLAMFLLLGGIAGAGFGQNKPAATGRRMNEGAATRGEYLVNKVAVCSQCHTPRNSTGAPDRSKWLEGAPLWLTSAEPVENWPLQAPRIAGALPGTDAEMVKLLTTGIWKTGTYLRPPMPQFRMSPEDAESVVAYLKSVTPAAK
jgi:mono/diheme cytochrome c family protein